MNEAVKLRILYFLVFACTASWLPIFADYLKDRGLSGVEIGIILSVVPVMMFLVQPLYGMLADRVGYKKCLLWSSFFASLSYIFYLFDGSFTSYFAITVCMAFFYNSIQPLLDSLALRLAQQNPGFSYGTLRIAGAAGWAITGTAVGYSIDNVNTTVIFAFSAVTMFLAFLFSFSIAPGKSSPAIQNGSSYKFSDIVTNRSLLFLLFCVFLVSAGGTTIWNFYSIYMKENGASASLVGYGLSLQGLCELPLFYFSARIIARFGIRVTLLLTVFATALRMLLYSIIRDPHWALFIELLHGVSWSLFWVVCVEYVNSLVREDWRVTGQSLLYAAYFGVGAIAGNFWTGYLYDAQMKIADIFLLNAGVALAVALLIMVFMRRKVAYAGASDAGGEAL